MKHSIQFVHLALLICHFCKKIQCMPEFNEDMLEDQGRNPANQDFAGRSDDEDEDRLPLPPFVLRLEAELDDMKCDKLYLVREDGYLTFKVDSPNQPCKYILSGSIVEKCRVAIMCKGKLNRSGKSPACKTDSFKVTDATDGKYKVCGGSKLYEFPLVARNNGTDLFLSFQSSSGNNAICTVFCVQDVKHEDKSMKKLAPLPQNPKLTGRSLISKKETNCVCGKRNNGGRIVNGDNAQKFEFPWITPIVISKSVNPKYQRQPFCSATLINDRYAITAAHCFAMGIVANQIQVVFHSHVMDKKVKRGDDPDHPKFRHVPGWNLPKQTDASEKSVRVGVSKIILHPQFNSKTYDYDVALLKLKYRINLKKTKKALPICLPDVNDQLDFTGKLLTVAGWGRHNENLTSDVRILQKLDMPFANLETCRYYNKPSPRHICAGYLEGGKDACYGDSGGPMIGKLNSSVPRQYVLAGIVSAGHGCARKDNYGLYTNVQEIIQWVYYHTQDGIFCSKK